MGEPPLNVRMKRTLLALTIVCTFAASLIQTPIAAAAFPGSNGAIAYTAYLGYQADLCVMEPDGTDARILVGGPGEQVDPAWSADGSKLAYVHFTHDSAAHIRVLNLANGTTADLGEGFGPSWSPTGDEIVFVDQGITIMDADGTDRRVIDSEGGGTNPAWSPDGDRIVFYDDVRDGMVDEGGLWLISPEGGEVQRVGDGGPATWSPDGERLVADGGYWQMVIFVLNADGTEQEILVESRGIGRDNLNSSTWSPDGSTIAFTRSLAKPYRTATDIWTVPAEGGEPQPLATTSVPEFDADWQPVIASTPDVPEGEPCEYDLHERAVTLELKKHLVATGTVTSVDGHESCGGAWVGIFRRKDGKWKRVRQNLTNQAGEFRIELPDERGRYRASAMADAECAHAHSPVLRHSH